RPARHRAVAESESARRIAEASGTAERRYVGARACSVACAAVLYVRHQVGLATVGRDAVAVREAGVARIEGAGASLALRRPVRDDARRARRIGATEVRRVPCFAFLPAELVQRVAVSDTPAARCPSFTATAGSSAALRGCRAAASCGTGAARRHDFYIVQPGERVASSKCEAHDAEDRRAKPQLTSQEPEWTTVHGGPRA